MSASFMGFLFGMGIIAVFALIGIGIGLLFLAYSLVVRCLLINKAEGNGWKGIIPFYGSYVFYHLGFNHKTAVCFFVVDTICTVVIYVINTLRSGSSSVIQMLNGNVSTSTATGVSLGLTAFAGILGLIALLLWIVNAVIRCFRAYAIANAFGQETLFCVLSIFFPIVMFSILAFGHAEYEEDVIEVLAD